MSDEHTQGLDTLAYCDRMLDYARAIHSLPESAARAEDQQDDVYGPQWNRAVCDCKLYEYAHAGCTGPAAKRLPRGWKSGDEPNRAA